MQFKDTPSIYKRSALRGRITELVDLSFCFECCRTHCDLDMEVLSVLRIMPHALLMFCKCLCFQELVCCVMDTKNDSRQTTEVVHVYCCILKIYNTQSTCR